MQYVWKTAENDIVNVNFLHSFSDFSRKNKSFSREIFGFSYFVGIAFFVNGIFFALETHNGITVEKVTFVCVRWCVACVSLTIKGRQSVRPSIASHKGEKRVDSNSF